MVRPSLASMGSRQKEVYVCVNLNKIKLTWYLNRSGLHIGYLCIYDGALFTLPVYLEKGRIKGKISLQKSHTSWKAQRQKWTKLLVLVCLDCRLPLSFAVTFIQGNIQRFRGCTQEAGLDPQVRVVGEGGRASSPWAWRLLRLFLQCFFMSYLDKWNA